MRLKYIFSDEVGHFPQLNNYLGNKKYIIDYQQE